MLPTRMTYCDARVDSPKLSTLQMADDSEDGPPVALSFAAGKELTIELSQKQSKEIQRYRFVYSIQ